MTHKTHWALYGNVVLKRGYCVECKRFAIVLDNRLQCCDALLKESPTKVRRMSDVPLGRDVPSREVQRKILKEQEQRCLYCQRLFGSKLWRGRKEIALRVTWDHVSPFVYSLDNRDQNFAAACQVCNSLKSCKIFQTLEDARVYLTNKAAQKGYTTVRPVLEILPCETDVAEIL